MAKFGGTVTFSFYVGPVSGRTYTFALRTALRFGTRKPFASRLFVGRTLNALVRTNIVLECAYLHMPDSFAHQNGLERERCRRLRNVHGTTLAQP